MIGCLHCRPLMLPLSKTWRVPYQLVFSSRIPTSFNLSRIILSIKTFFFTKKIKKAISYWKRRLFSVRTSNNKGIWLKLIAFPWALPHRVTSCYPVLPAALWLPTYPQLPIVSEGHEAVAWPVPEKLLIQFFRLFFAETFCWGFQNTDSGSLNFRARSITPVLQLQLRWGHGIEKMLWQQKSRNDWSFLSHIHTSLVIVWF